MSSRTPQHRLRATGRAALCPALALLLATLVMCLGCGMYDREERAAAPLVAAPDSVASVASMAEERLGSPAGHNDACSGTPSHEIRAVLPVAALPLPAVLARVPFVPRPAAASYSPALPAARAAPDLHVLQVQRI
ncbi:hypothetical protein G5C60_34760 [Streptomyces sp. HC44]|uniref:Uncharacterized protein n=1 Tax=Streptomyces scabichelini TaxID=2711217 RepID=A0A6G4VEX3_9ACTN|nr:hypothetical protein [Streptomyces scabichelini]NGO12636.1 hypothetical protein [Streptomyces scabichelini]